MKWCSVISERSTATGALGEVLDDLRRSLAGAAPHLLLVFVSPHHGLHFERVMGSLREAFPEARLVGCTAAGVVGGGHELEGVAGLAVTAAVLPDVAVEPFHLPPELVKVQGGLDDDGVAIAVGVDPDAVPALVVMCEPYSCNTEALVLALDRTYPRSAVVGGLASGGREAGQHRLFLDDRVLTEGAVGVALFGDVVMDTVVAQGCRPVGPAMRVTLSKGRLVKEIDGDPAVEVLQNVFDDLEPRSRKLFQRSPMIGVAMDPSREAFSRGDFLVRHIVGVDPKRQVVVVGHHLSEGDVIQFHVRDAQSSAEDLNDLMGRHVRSHGAEPPAGALLFSCLGRGKGFYGIEDHDVRAIREHAGGVAVGGFFGNGEIGPVHGQTFLHGYTASIGLFRPRAWN